MKVQLNIKLVINCGVALRGVEKPSAVHFASAQYITLYTRPEVVG